MILIIQYIRVIFAFGLHHLKPHLFGSYTEHIEAKGHLSVQFITAH